MFNTQFLAHLITNLKNVKPTIRDRGTMRNNVKEIPTLSSATLSLNTVLTTKMGKIEDELDMGNIVPRS